MTLSTSEWHQRYLQQAGWTQNLRKYIYDQVDIINSHKILDVGCGSGILEKELEHRSHAQVIGLDIDMNILAIAGAYAPNASFSAGDCLQLPFPTGQFDITLCHFLLLWVKDSIKAVVEMARVTRRDGFVLALAEPDYGGRIDFPEQLAQIGSWQVEALKSQGANPFTGRELRSIFSHAGLGNIETGVLGGQWKDSDSDDDLDLEWNVIDSDLHNKHEFLLQRDNLRLLDQTSRKKGQRIMYVPTFYAYGKVL